jgi:carbamoyl-phosphate synthase large subunit
MTRTPFPLPVPRLPVAGRIGSFGGGDDRRSVLVTGSGGPAGTAVIRRLLALGHRVVGADADPAAAGGALADVRVTVPHADHPRFIDALLGAAAA